MSGRGRSIHLVANPRAGRGRGPGLGVALTWLLRDCGLSTKATCPTDESGMRTALVSAVEARPASIVVAGGDGTLRLAAQAITAARSETILAPLRCGTGNGLSDALGLPRDLEAYAELLTRDAIPTLSLHTAQTERGLLLHTLGAGLDAAMVERVSVAPRRALGRAGWVLPVLRELLSNRRYQIGLTVDGEPRGAFEQLLAPRFANHGGVLHLPEPIGRAPRQLDLVAFRPRSRLRWLLTALRGATGRLQVGRDLEHFRGREAALELVDDPAPVHLDGEPFGQTPIEVGLRATTLRLLAPAPSHRANRCSPSGNRAAFAR